MKSDGTLYDVDPFWDRQIDPCPAYLKELERAIRKNVTLPSPYKFLPWATRLGSSKFCKDLETHGINFLPKF